MRRKLRMQVLALVSGACLFSSAALSQVEPLKIGMFTMKSGPYATISARTELAAAIAVDEVNAAGGIHGRKIELVMFDTAGKPDQAALGLRTFGEPDGVLAIVGPFTSSEARVVFPAAERLELVSMSNASSAPGLTKGFTYAFRNTAQEGAMFDAVLRTLQGKFTPSATAAVAYANDDVISRTLGEELYPALLKKHNLKVVQSVNFKMTAFDLAAQVAQIKAVNPDVVAIGASPDTASKFAKELRRQGVKARLIGSSTIASADLPKRMGAEGAGTLFATAFYADMDARTRAFSDQFVKRAKAAGVDDSLPSQFDAATYDIVLFYAHAMKVGNVRGTVALRGKERTAIRDSLRSLKDFPGVEGKISLGTEGDAIKPIYVLEIKGSEFRLVEAHQP